MSFWKRIRVYIIGVGIGSLMVLFLFGDRGCGGWLPGNRVKTSIIESIFETSDLIDCKLTCNGFTKEKVEDLILKGIVLFKQSKTDTDPREYIIEHESKQLTFAVPVDSEYPIYLIDNFKENCTECDSVSNKFDRTIKLNFKKKK